MGVQSNGGGATPGRARSNALAKKLLPWLAPWLAPWLTEISINSINIERNLPLYQPRRGFTFGSSQSSQLYDLTTVLTWKWPGYLDVLAPPLRSNGANGAGRNYFWLYPYLWHSGWSWANISRKLMKVTKICQIIKLLGARRQLGTVATVTLS